MTNPAPLTQNELRAAAYFAVGVTSEGSIGGRDVAYRLSFAGTVGRDGRMDPIGNSGYSFGTLQIDLGQHPDEARHLLHHYQHWATTQPDRAALHLDADAYDALLASLQRTGREMRAAQAHDIDRRHLNRFLASDAGKTFVHGLDRQHVESVTQVDATVGNRDSALELLQRTALYQDAAHDDQARMAGLIMKLHNQSGRAFTPRLLSRIEQGELQSADDVKTAIDGLLRNHANGHPDYIESGADNTLRGVGLFNALRSTTPPNPLATAWGAVVADPLIGPVAAHAPNQQNPNRGVQFDTVRSLFLSPESAQRMVLALESGATRAEGDPAPRSGRRSAGYFVAGQDFVHWNASGQGVACIGGEWRSVDPDQLRRVANRDGTVDLQLTEGGRTMTLLHVDPQALKPGQSAAASSVEEPVHRAAPDRAAAGQDDARQRHADARHPDHPDHALYLQAEQAVARIDASMGRVRNESSERMIAAGVLMATQHGLDRIDHMVLSRQTSEVAAGQHVFVVQGAIDNPAHLRAHMPTEQALRSTPEQAYALAESLARAPAETTRGHIAEQQDLTPAYAHRPPAV